MKVILTSLISLVLIGGVALGLSVNKQILKSNHNSNSTEIVAENSQKNISSYRLPSQFVGKWTLTNSDIKTSELFPSNQKYTIEESIWSGLANGASQLELLADGSIEFMMYDKLKTGFIEVIEDSKEIKFIFIDGSKRSQTNYIYSIAGGQLVLELEDPMVSEKYYFSKS